MAPVRQVFGQLLLRAARAIGANGGAMEIRKPPADIDRWIFETWEVAKPRTMTSIERVAALCNAVEHIQANSVTGDIVECGVWRGGSMIAAALTLKRLATVRPLWLYDTFSGMTTPRSEDVDFQGRPAVELLAAEDPDTSANWAKSTVADTKRGLAETGYPMELAKFIVGPVEDTIPANAPDEIALLRLDTDWYQSTYHELVHLWPRLVDGGVLIVDDYGHWAGAKKAVDQYFTEQGLRPFLHRIDYTGRLVIKMPSSTRGTSFSI
jgi:O-methyltransferase